MVFTELEVDTMPTKLQPGRRYDAALKSRVLNACAQPGASIAAVASVHGLDADVVHKWRYQLRRRLLASDVNGSAGARSGEFIALSLPSSRADTETNIRIEVRRGKGVVVVSWPIAAVGQCASWLEKYLR